MRTRYILLDTYGSEINLDPWVTHEVDMDSVELIPNNDPEDPTEDELVIRVRLRHHG